MHLCECIYVCVVATFSFKQFPEAKPCQRELTSRVTQVEWQKELMLLLGVRIPDFNLDTTVGDTQGSYLDVGSKRR